MCSLVDVALTWDGALPLSVEDLPNLGFDNLGNDEDRTDFFLAGLEDAIVVVDDGVDDSPPDEDMSKGGVLDKVAALDWGAAGCFDLAAPSSAGTEERSALDDTPMR